MARVDEPAVGPRDDLYATVRLDGIVQRRPQGDERVAVQVGPPVLVPYEGRAFPAGLVHEHRPEAGHRRVRTVDALADLLEDRFLHEGEIHGVQFQVLDLAVAQGGPLVAPGLWPGLIAPALRIPVELHHDPAVVDIGPAQHDVVDALLEPLELARRHHGAETQVALPFEYRPLVRGDPGIHDGRSYGSDTERMSASGRLARQVVPADSSSLAKRNVSLSMVAGSPRAVSASHSPKTEENLKPVPLKPQPTVTRS